MKEPTRIKWFAFMVAMWTLLMVVVASPAWAHDDDDDDNSGHGSSHSQKDDDDDDDDDTSDDGDGDGGGPPPVTTTTVVPTPTTTTPPAPATTTTTIAPPTTTTTTTTTTTFPRDTRWEQQRIEEWSDTTTTSTTDPVQYESKDSLVLAIASSNDGDEGGPDETEGNGFHIFPREGLTVAFRSAVETIENQLALAIILGTLISGLTMVGFDDRTKAQVSGSPSSASHRES